MQSNNDTLKITLHLTDGRVVHFSQPRNGDPSDVLNGVSLSKVFEQKILLLQGEESVSLFPTDKIARLDVSRMVTSWVMSRATIQADQIADYDFQWLRETLAAVQRQYPERRRGENAILAADIELSNNEHLYLRVEFNGDGGTEKLQEIFVDQILNSNGLMIRLREGNYGIINPKSLVRLTIYPVLENSEVTVLSKAIGLG